MVETYTRRGRAIKQEYGTNPEAWGGELNAGGQDILDAMWGTTATVTVNGDVTLTSIDKLPDQARGFVLPLSGSGGFTVTVPAVDKPYLVVNNCSANVNIRPGLTGTPAVVRAGTAVLVYTDSVGTTASAVDPTLDKIKTAAADVDFGGKKLINAAKGTVSTDVATLSNSVSELALPSAPLAMNGQKITGLANGTASGDAVNYGQTVGIADAAAASAASAAADAATVAAIYDQFDDRWLGPKNSDPTVDNDGNTLLVGAAYWNTPGAQLRIWSGSAWVPISTVTLASQVQAEAGTDNTTVMTPLRTAQAISAQAPAGRRNFTATGTLPNGATVVLNSDGTVSTVTSNNDTVGTSAVFKSAAITYVAAAALSATQVAIAWANGQNLEMVIGVISGTSLTFPGSVVTLNLGTGLTTQYVSVAQLSSSSFVVACNAAGTGASGDAVVCTVSGNTITAGSVTAFNASTSPYVSVAALSATKVVIAFQDGGNSSYGTAIIGTVSGTTISFGSKAVFQSSNPTIWTAVAAMSSTTFLIAYSIGSGGTAIVGSAPSTTISYGASVNMGVGSVLQYTSIAVLSPTSAFIAFGESTTAGSGIIATISGTTVSFGGTKATFKANQCDWINVSKITASRVVVTFTDVGNSSYGAVVLGNISGNTITYEAPIVFKSASSTNIGATANTANDRVFIGFRDGGNSNFGTGVVFQPAATNISSWIGIAAAAISNGASGPVTILGGVNASLSGLTTNATYYYANDGTLTTTVTNYKAGRALSSSSLLITGAAQ